MTNRSRLASRGKVLPCTWHIPPHSTQPAHKGCPCEGVANAVVIFPLLISGHQLYHSSHRIRPLRRGRQDHAKLGPPRGVATPGEGNNRILLLLRRTYTGNRVESGGRGGQRKLIHDLAHHRCYSNGNRASKFPRPRRRYAAQKLEDTRIRSSPGVNA
jgi:hypothetical protein